MNNIQKRMQELTKELKQYNYEYYVLDAPTVEDIEYDSKMRELEKLELEYPEFADPSTPTKQVGSFLKTDLEYWTIPEIILIKEPINVPLTKENLNTLISLRHGKIHEYSVNKKYKKINSIEIEDSFNQRQVIDFYEEEKEEECIFYTQKLYPNSIENQNSMYELSKWTYDRLFKLLREN